MSVLAEHEAETISKRIKDALKVKKQKMAKGDFTNKAGLPMKVKRLGGPNGIPEGMNELAEIGKKENALNNEQNLKAYLSIKALEREAKYPLSITDMVNHLNDNGYKARRGGVFQYTQVKRLLNKYENYKESELLGRLERQP